MYNLYMGCIRNVLRINKIVCMSYEIEIEYYNQDGCIFYIGETPYEVELYIETRTFDEPDSYNSFTDTIKYVQLEERYYRVDQTTLRCDGINYYDNEDICEQLEEMLNE